MDLRPRELRTGEFGNARMAQFAVGVLNGKPIRTRENLRSAAVTRVVRLLQNLQALDSMRIDSQIHSPGDSSDVAASVNEQLSQLRWSPVVVLSGGSVVRLFRFHVAKRRGSSEDLAIFLLLEALSAGNIGRFRKCPSCAKWFYANTAHQNYCSENCRKKLTSGSPQFKKRRRDYMKDYRLREKARDLEALKNTRIRRK